MKVPLLEKCIDRFLSAQVKSDPTEWHYPHSMVHQFHDHWSSPQQVGFKEIYDQCLWSDYSQRWWKRDHYRPKEIMMFLIDADPELAAIAWKDLSNDASSLDGRLSRFDYYCNELLQIHRAKPPGSLESYHYQDASVMSLYLSGLFPDKYALYPGLEIFKNFCKAVGSQDIPVIDDLVRYMKVASIVHTYLQKNPGLERLKQLRSSPLHKVSNIPFLLSYEVIHFEGSIDKTSAYGF
ncbi:MAG TPA: hypothetical protein VGK46_12975 [Saprospiraceae bacterium]